MISHSIVDKLTLASAVYSKRWKPKLDFLLAIPGGRFLVKLPRKLLDGLAKAVGILHPSSDELKSVKANIDEIQVAQIGGTTRTFLDDAKHLIRFNTHDWRSDENSKESSDYVKIEGGTELPWQDNSFDVVASRHALEHIANPVSAILEWKRILKPGGLVYVSVPDRRKTPEYVRKLTTLSHFIDDFQNDVPEFDLTHKEEIERTGVGIIEHDRYENPHIHYHTFEPKNLKALLGHCGLNEVALSVGDLEILRHKPWDLIVMAKKPLEG